jgi:phosphohistidine phosphatase
MAGSLATRSIDMKTLYLVRHAKSSWTDPSLADFHRPLNKRGRRDAPAMGQRLAENKIKVDAIWSSPALRAVQTAELLAPSLKVPRKCIEQHERLYTSSIKDLFAEISTCSDTIQALLVIGHNPVMTELADLLVNHDHTPEFTRIPTCGVVALELQCPSWNEIQGSTGQLLFFDFPKNKQ